MTPLRLWRLLRLLMALSSEELLSALQLSLTLPLLRLEQRSLRLRPQLLGLEEGDAIANRGSAAIELLWLHAGLRRWSRLHGGPGHLRLRRMQP